MNPRRTAPFVTLALAGLAAASFLISPAAAGPEAATRFAFARARAGATASPVDQTPVACLFVDAAVDPAPLEARGAVLGPPLPNGVRTLRIPLAALDALADTPGLDRVAAAVRCRPLNNLSVPATGATPAFWTAPVAGNFGGNAGNGVIIGVVDTGIDWTHDDLKHPDGTTRILSIWDQTEPGAPPAGFGYGVEWSAAQINAGGCTHEDTDGHGTHVAGSAAGDGSATGAGQPPFLFAGVAPEADLIVVATDFQTTSIVDGVQYVFQRAAGLGRDAVVLVGAGTQFGPHDGTDLFDTSLDALTGPGKILVTSAGNAGGAARHAEQNMTPPASVQTISFNIPAYSANPGSQNDFVAIDAWYGASAALQVTVTSPGPAPVVLGPVPVGGNNVSANLAAGDIAIDARGTGPSGDRNIRIELSDQNGTPPRAGVWTITLTPVTAPPGTQVDAWLADFQLGAMNTAPEFTTDVEEAELVASPGSASTAITAGSFVTKARWLSIDGLEYFYTEGLNGLGTLAGYSSPGPLRNGAPKPELTAPGSAIVSALSAQATLEAPFVNPDGKHATSTGTSMAAAHVAGAVALLLAVQPGQSPADLEAKLAIDAVSDNFTGVVPNARWGAGKLKLVNADTVPPRASLLTPNGGENLPLGSPFTITWSATDLVGVASITLEFSANDGGTYSPIATSLANSGSFNWTVPNAPTTLGRIRVRAFDAAGNSGLDASDAPFRITDQTPPSVTVTAPNGGQDFGMGTVQTISWNATDNVGVVAVALDYSLDDGNAWIEIAAGEPNDGGFFWSLPATPSSQVLVRVRASDLAGNTGQDVSDAVFSISDRVPPVVGVTAPNGGESWEIGTTQTIGWTATDNVAVTAIQLEFSTNGGGNWTTLATDEPNDGQYAWLIPPQPTTGLRVRVTARDAAGNVGIDASNANASLVDATPPELAITAPTAGEQWEVGDSRAITWTATDNVAVASIRIEFSANDGSSWTTIAPSAPNTGTFNWVVPSTPTTVARFRLTATDTSSRTTVRTSDAFTIVAPDATAPNVTLSIPNGGEVWASGSEQTVSWNATDDVGVTSVLVEFASTAGGTFTTIVDLAGNPGSHLWTVPAVATTQARIRVTARDGAGNARQDQSDGPFTIQIPDTEAPSVTVTAPNGGESLPVAAARTISWTAEDNVGVTAVTIEFSANNGGAWSVVAADEPNDGNFPWTVPNAPTTQALVRITARDAAANSASDVSDAPFTISAVTPQPVTVTVNTVGSVEVNGYRMVTWPVIPTNAALSATLEDDLGAPDVTRWRFGRWDPLRGGDGGYRSADGGDLAGVDIGHGYWILTRESKAIDVIGRPIDADTLSIPLPGPAGGWHQVGNPFRTAIPFDALQFRLAGGGTAAVTQALRGWSGDGAYSVVGTGASLAPQTGYWIQKTDGAQQRLLFRRTAASAAGTALTTLPGSQSSGTAALPPAATAGLTLEARHGGLEAGRVTLAFADVPAGRWNAASRALPPPVPGGGQPLHVLIEEWGEMNGGYDALVYPAGAPVDVALVPGESGSGAPLELVWTEGLLPAGWGAWLHDPTTGRVLALVPGVPVHPGAASGSAGYRLRVAPLPDDPMKTPVARLLAQPNPFHAATRLSLAGGGTGVEELQIFDAFGRLKRRLAVDPGGDTQWDGRDDQGRGVPAGFYYVRARSATGTVTLRVVRLPVRGER